MNNPKIEQISSNNELLCMIIKGDMDNKKTRFLTPEDKNVQVGFIVYSKGSEIQKHIHKKLERQIRDTFEVLIIRRGKCIADVYDNAKNLVATRTLGQGDILIMFTGGHGFRMLEDTEFLEVKQGPYFGTVEKELF